MKKIYFIVGFLFLCLGSLNAQRDAAAANRAKEIKEVTFWGVDYSLAKFYGVQDAPIKIYNVLWPINYLFIGEPQKYNVGKLFKKDVIKDLSIIQEKTKGIVVEELVTNNPNYRINDELIGDLLKNLNLPANNGIGLIFIGECMNKVKNEGSYYVVFFDNTTRNIIFMKNVTGSAKGFGLRNYWANSVLDIMESWKYKP